MLRPTRRIAKHGVGQALRHTAMAFGAIYLHLRGGGQGRRVRARTLALGADVFVVAARAAVLRVVEDDRQRHTDPISDFAVATFGTQQAFKGGMVPRGLRCRRTSLHLQARGERHRRISPGIRLMAGEAGGIAHRYEGLPMAGGAILLQERVPARQRTAGPLLLRMKSGNRVIRPAVEKGIDRPAEAQQQHRQKQGIGSPALVYHAGKRKHAAHIGGGDAFRGD